MSSRASGLKVSRKFHRGFPVTRIAAIMAAASYCSAGSASGAGAYFNAVGKLDPNAGGAISLVDAASNSNPAVNGVTYINFNKSIRAAFTAGTGGVLNFGDAGILYNGTAVPSTVVPTNGAVGVNTNANQFTTSYGPGSNTFTFNRSDGGANIQYGNANGSYLASGAASGDYLTFNAVPAVPGAGYNLSFFQPLSAFGITFIPRGSPDVTGSTGAGLRTALLTVDYFNSSNGVTTTTSSSKETTDAGGIYSNQAVFFGFNAPTGLTITGININVGTGAMAINTDRFDDLAFIVAQPPVAVVATPLYWSPVGNTRWNSANWSPNPGGGSLRTLKTNGSNGVTFAATTVTSASNLITTLGADQNVGFITVKTGVGAVSIGGTNKLTIGSGGISMVAGGPLTINTTGQVILGANQNWSTGSANITVSSPITGTGNLTIAGSHTVLLSGNNSYTGTTDVSGGILKLGNASALGAGKLAVNGGTVDLAGFNTTLTTLDGSAGLITSTGSGTTTLTVANTGDKSTGVFAPSINDGSSKIAVVVNSGGNVTLAGGANDYSGNTYSGGTTVNGGGILSVGDQTLNVNVPADLTLGTGPVTVGSTFTPVATLRFATQLGAGSTSLHTFANPFSITGNAVILNAEGTNTLSGPISLNGLNDSVGILLGDKPLILGGPISGNATVALYGYGKASVNPGFGGGGYISIGNNASGRSVNNTGFTGTFAVNNSLTDDNVHGVQILALQNAFLPNGTIAFSADLPVAGVGPAITGFNTYNSSAVTFARGVTAPQIGALSSSEGGAIALATQGLEGVNLTLGLNNSTGSTYAGNLYDNSKAADGATSGSLTKIGRNAQILTGTDDYAGGTNVSAGTLTFASPGALPNFTALTIGKGALANAATHVGTVKNTLFTSSLNIAASGGVSTGKLDLANNDLVVQKGSLSTIYAAVKQGFNGGSQNGTAGIVSSTAAAANSRHLTTLGVIQNSADGKPSGTVLYSPSDSTPNAFDGATVGADTDVLVKYTYFGDANLDGKIDGSDFSRIDAGFIEKLTGWYNGDFNYDGVVNQSDYTLIDNAFTTQNGKIASELATPAAEIAASSPVSAVPEPTGVGLLGLGAAGLLRRRNRPSG